MALAAARQLSVNGDQADALRAADNWMARNNRDSSRVECCTFADWRPIGAPDGVVDTVTATSRASHTTLFLDYLGLPKLFSVERSATAQVVGAAGAPVCPWGIIADPPVPNDDGHFGLVPGRVYAFDLAAGSSRQRQPPAARPGRLRPRRLSDGGCRGLPEGRDRQLVGRRRGHAVRRRGRRRRDDAAGAERLLQLRDGRRRRRLPRPPVVRYHLRVRRRGRRRPHHRLRPLRTVAAQRVRFAARRAAPDGWLSCPS